MRSGKSCNCDDGWSGINCNVCTSNQACNALMPDKEGGVCYTGGDVVNHNYQMCDVVNKKITNLLGDQKPQVTFTCDKEDKTCQFQCMAHPQSRSTRLMTSTSCLYNAFRAYH